MKGTFSCFSLWKNYSLHILNPIFSNYLLIKNLYIMKISRVIYLSLFLSCFVMCKTVDKIPKEMKQDSQLKITPPIAKKEAFRMEKHGDVRVDNYYWMKLSDEQKNAETPDAQTQDVLDYLNAENDYTQKKMGHLSTLRNDLYEEIVGRIKQTDMSVPYYKNGYHYLTKYTEGKEYPIYSRKKGGLEADEELLLDVNVLADGLDYYAARGLSVSPDNKMLAYGEDKVSRRIYTIKFKDLESGKLLPDIIENTTGSIVWANDNKTIFYTRKDKSLRAYKIFKHILGSPTSEDQEIYHEEDETFSCYVYKTKSQKFIVIGSYATVSNEYRYVDADNPSEDFKLFQKRERDHEHNIYHFDGNWYITTNKDGASNFKVMITPETDTGKENWTDFISHKDDVLISRLAIFKKYLVVNERVDGITKVKVAPWDNLKKGYYIDFGEDSYDAYTSTNLEFDTEKVRLGFSSMTTPFTTYDYDMSAKTLDLKKRQEVLGEFNSDDYVSEYFRVPAADGAMVPVNMVYKKGYKKDGSQPLLLYAYGSYGSSMDPYFSSVRLSLLNRGFAFAIAHIRGGQELGRAWYDNGKLLNKKNTFTDFINVGEHLVKNNYTSSDKLFCMGGSAGGLLIGAVINMQPELWKGAIAAVPFVDVITTMLDETIPLTTGEYDEWGNPNDKTYYDYIKSYSPYDQVQKKAYPHLLVTTGYHDSQVQYWEPAKWVAKLRDYKTDENLLLLHTEMGAGHGGKSGRFQRYRETALEYAFLLDLVEK